jgi:ligand-binding SRPBCC domain-containing protein
MKRYFHRFLVQAPLDRVARFHHDSKALKLLTPPPIFFQARSIEPMGENSKAEFIMWIGPIPVHWLAIHSEVDWSKGFIDTQVQGPFEHWVHRHAFCEISEGVTEVADEIHAMPGNGFWHGILSRLMWVNLPLLFAYRGWKTRKYLENT